MTEFVTIMEAACKPAKTRRKPLMDKEELSFLHLVREARVSVQKGLKTTVVISKELEFDEVFKHYSKVMRIHEKTGLLIIKTIDQISVEDLDGTIVELDV